MAYKVVPGVTHSVRQFTWGDLVVLLTILVLIYFGIRLGIDAPLVTRQLEISLAPSALPAYAGLSLARMGIAYLLSLLFTFGVGYFAYANKAAANVILPLLDVLQSVPILSFLPVAVLGLSAFLPLSFAVELSSILLIFTSQVWNLTFAWYQSLTTVPGDLREAVKIYRFNPWLRFRELELPFAAIPLIWNSIMSWAGGWFFLMAAEIFTVGKRDFRLPGLGAYLQEAVRRDDAHAIWLGVATLVALIVALDQLVWRPLLAWADRFKLDTMGTEETPATSWLFDALHASHLVDWARRWLMRPMSNSFNRTMAGFYRATRVARVRRKSNRLLGYVGGLLITGLILFGAYRATNMLLRLNFNDWMEVGTGLGATFLRVIIALVIALAWTLPVGIAVASSRRLTLIVQPLLQIAASIPATALFPVILLALLSLPNGLNLGAVLLMLLGTQWYLLFNIIAGASAIPQDLKYMATTLKLSRVQRWRILLLPALFPYIVTGALTATGGAWNASIVAEYSELGGRVYSTKGIGATIAKATADGNYPMLLAATLAMILTVVFFNRFVWRRLYRFAEDRFRME